MPGSQAQTLRGTGNAVAWEARQQCVHISSAVTIHHAHVSLPTGITLLSLKLFRKSKDSKTPSVFKFKTPPAEHSQSWELKGRGAVCPAELLSPLPFALCSFRGRAWPGDTSCTRPGTLKLPKSCQAWVCSARQGGGAGAGSSSLGGQPRHSPTLACLGLSLPHAKWAQQMSPRIV